AEFREHRVDGVGEIDARIYQRPIEVENYEASVNHASWVTAGPDNCLIADCVHRYAGLKQSEILVSSISIQQSTISIPPRQDIICQLAWEGSMHQGRGVGGGAAVLAVLLAGHLALVPAQSRRFDADELR